MTVSKQPTELDDLTTEANHPESTDIDSLSAIEIVELMNAQDAVVAKAVADVSDAIAEGIDLVVDRVGKGGRLVYFGAGTSGRLGVLDASECPPTFSTPPELVVGLIAGGSEALTRAIEGAEDIPEAAVNDLKSIDVGSADVVVGIATSGRTPYVVGGLKYARQVGAATIGFCCNEKNLLREFSDVMIIPVVGPEIISGSTRMKAGTATKMVLNMLSTGTMIRLGKTYGNRMVDLTATNHKLTIRSQRIVSQLCQVTCEEAASLLDRCDGELKTAVVVAKRSVSPQQARLLLDQCAGHLRLVIEKGAL